MNSMITVSKNIGEMESLLNKLSNKRNVFYKLLESEYPHNAVDGKGTYQEYSEIMNIFRGGYYEKNINTNRCETDSIEKAVETLDKMIEELEEKITVTKHRCRNQIRNWLIESKLNLNMEQKDPFQKSKNYGYYTCSFGRFELNNCGTIPTPNDVKEMEIELKSFQIKQNTLYTQLNSHVNDLIKTKSKNNVGKEIESLDINITKITKKISTSKAKLWNEMRDWLVKHSYELNMIRD